MSFFVLSAEPGTDRSTATEQRLRAAIPGLREVKHIEDALRAELPAEGPNHLFLIAPPRDAASLSKLADMAARCRDRLFFVLIGGELSASDYKSLVRTGGADWLPADADVQEILDLVSARQMRSRPDAPGTARPLPGRAAVCFVSSAGGAGNTTLAVEVGAALKIAKSGRDTSICIVDADFQNGHVCDQLDIEPRLKIEEISSDPERLDAQLFEIFISRHASGLHVFAAPRSKLDPCGIDVGALDRLFDMISARYQLILIDLPVTWLAWTPQIISASDGIVVTGLNTIPGLRRLAGTVTAVREVARPSVPIAVAVNRCQRRLFGRIARRHHVESVLAGEQVFYVGEEPTVLESANTGTPLAISRGSRGFTRDIARIADFCLQVKTKAAASAS
jgi:pilus assembly protein CpaE